MNENRGTLEALAGELSVLLSPLSSLTPATAPVFLAEIGLALDEAQVNSIAPTLTQTASAISKLIELHFELDASIEADGKGLVIQKRIAALDQIRKVISGFDQLKLSLTGLGLPGTGPAIVDLPKRLFDYLLAKYLEHSQGANQLLELAGILERTDHNIGVFDPAKPFYTTNEFHFGRMGGWLSDPSRQLGELYDWGKITFDGTKVLQVLDRMVAEYGLPTLYDPSLSPPLLDLVFLRLLPRTDLDPRGIELRLTQGLSKGSIELGTQRWAATLNLDTNVLSDTSILIRPGTITIQPPEATKLTGKLGAVYSFVRGAQDPLVLLSFFGAGRATIEEIAASVELRFGPDGVGQLILGADLKGGKVRISAEGADGFVAKLLGGFQVESNFDLGIDYSLSGGLHFRGSSGLEIQMASHFNLGPLAVNALTLSVGIKDGTFPVAITADLQTALGPLTAIVHGLGFQVAMKLVSDNKGNLGPVDIQSSFRPPNGVGLSLDAGGFTGGGFLMFDDEKAEYAGALELDFQGMLSVKAIGIINTKMPDGAPGFSLLIVISAEFTPIQLSFGFTLNGVGGIIGLSRTLVVAALAEGIRTNAIKSILFPENVVANISRIVSDIKQFFPPQQDHFVVGPMAKLGWGTPSIVTLELGLLLDLPNPMFAMVGVLKAVLPHEDAPILRLQVNFIGVVDFEHGYVFFRADLYDSRLLVYSITGSMAFLVSWGEQQTFAVSVGGFHPDFRDIPSIPALPNGFRNMARIGISLLSDDNPRLKVESYFAVTSNTVQFGARVELYAEAVGFNVYGFLGYDVLFQFDPFRFMADLYGGIALREGTSVIAGINISAKLSGPTPWDALGDASLTILFFEISVGFHVTWGDPPPAISLNTEDLLKLLQRELADTRNWRAELPPDNHLHVTLKKLSPEAGKDLLVIHPAGVLTFSQRSLPLEDYAIQKFGSKKPLNETKFKLSNANSDGTAISADYQGVREQFAPGNFTELSDSDKLSRRSFERLPSGFKLTATSDLLVTLPVSRPVVYELSYLRRKESGLIFGGLVKLALRAYTRLVKGSAVRQSALSLQQNRISLNAPAQVVLPRESFAVASKVDLRSHIQGADGPVLFATQAEAYQRQQEIINRNPALAGQIQVVSHFELNPN